MKSFHLKILLLCLLVPPLCYGGWAFLFHQAAPPEQSYVVPGEDMPAPALTTSASTHNSPREQCDGIGAIALYSILLPCIAEHNQSSPHRGHTKGKPAGLQTPVPVASPSP
jgi:hypothetical protein